MMLLKGGPPREGQPKTEKELSCEDTGTKEGVKDRKEKPYPNKFKEQHSLGR